MPNPRYQKNRKQRIKHLAVINNELEFSEELTQPNLEYENMQPVPQPKDYDEIEY